MNSSFKQSMRWLHTWVGLISAWLLFVVFLTGTASYYKEEISNFMKPELYDSKPSNKTVDIAMQKASILINNKVSNFLIALPNDRNNTIKVTWTQMSENQRPIRARSEFDATSGEELISRSTFGGHFLYRFHYRLYGIPAFWGEWIIAIVAMAMFVTIITGIFIHTKIFKDLFVFRPDKKIRNWMDAHILPSIASLPFLIMISYSSLVLSMHFMMPWAMNSFYEDYRFHMQKLYKGADDIYANSYFEDKYSFQREDITKENLMTIYNKAQVIYPDNIGMISMNYNMYQDTYDVKITPKNPDSIFNKNTHMQSLVFDAKTTNLIQKLDVQTTTNPTLITNIALSELHKARFANAPIRALFFILGVIGTIIIATGLILWNKKRQQKYETKNHLGYKLVEKLNIGTILGLPIAVCVYFIANKIVPFDYINREIIEVNSLFIAWLISYLHAFFIKSKNAWSQQLFALSMLCFTIVLLDIILFKTFGNFDIFFLVTGIVFAFAFYKKFKSKL